MPGSLDEPGVYLTDGVRLVQVVRADRDKKTVLLEDCRFPDLPCEEFAVGQLATDGFRIVRGSDLRL